MEGLRAFRLYVAILFAISLPFWALGFFSHSFLPAWLPLALPPSALMAFMPAVAASILLWRSRGRGAVGELLARSFDVRRIRSAGWLAAAMLTMPAVLVTGYCLMTLSGIEIPGTRPPLIAVPIMAVMFFVAAAGEELGWQGFAFETLDRHLSVLGSALLIGAVWAAWHIVPFFQTGHAGSWVIWQCLVTVFLRVVTVWLYVYGGRSVFLAVVFHTMTNVSMFLFPNYGSFYDPSSTAVILALVTALLATFWGPRMLEERA